MAEYFWLYLITFVKMVIGHVFAFVRSSVSKVTKTLSTNSSDFFGEYISLAANYLIRDTIQIITPIQEFLKGILSLRDRGNVR